MNAIRQTETDGHGEQTTHLARRRIYTCRLVSWPDSHRQPECTSSNVPPSQARNLNLQTRRLNCFRSVQALKCAADKQNLNIVMEYFFLIYRVIT